MNINLEINKIDRVNISILMFLSAKENMFNLIKLYYIYKKIDIGVINGVIIEKHEMCFPLIIKTD